MFTTQQGASPTAAAQTGGMWYSCCPPQTPGPTVAAPRGCPAAQLGISGYHVAGSGEYVLDVEPGSEAERLGLKQGDLILALNGCQLTDHGAWDRAMSYAAAGGLSVLIHDGQTGDIHCRRSRVYSPPWA